MVVDRAQGGVDIASRCNWVTSTWCVSRWLVTCRWNHHTEQRLEGRRKFADWWVRPCQEERVTRPDATVWLVNQLWYVLITDAFLVVALTHLSWNALILPCYRLSKLYRIFSRWCVFFVFVSVLIVSSWRTCTLTLSALPRPRRLLSVIGVRQLLGQMLLFLNILQQHGTTDRGADIVGPCGVAPTHCQTHASFQIKSNQIY